MFPFGKPLDYLLSTTRGITDNKGGGESLISRMCSLRYQWGLIVCSFAGESEMNTIIHLKITRRVSLIIIPLDRIMYFPFRSVSGLWKEKSAVVKFEIRGSIPPALTIGPHD